MMEINFGNTELQKNYKHVGTLSHSFDRFYVVTKSKLWKVQDSQFTTIPYDKGCNHLDDVKSKGRCLLGLIEEVKE